MQKYDELINARIKGECFFEFNEAPIEFLPTFKFDVEKKDEDNCFFVPLNQYDSSNKKRIPSWTDRILFKSRKTNLSLFNLFADQLPQISVVKYNSFMNMVTSDHKPGRIFFIQFLGYLRLILTLSINKIHMRLTCQIYQYAGAIW